MRLLLSLVLVLLALGVAWMNYDGPRLGQPIVILPKGTSTIHRSPEASNFRVRDRVFHNKFGHGTVVATDGAKLTIQFDDGGMKQIVDAFVARSNEAPSP